MGSLKTAFQYKGSDCIAGYGGTAESSPFQIRGLVFEKRTVGQSIPFPGCNNTLTVTLQTNVPLISNSFCQPIITIQPFTSASFPSGNIWLAAYPGQCPVGSNSASNFQSIGLNGQQGFGSWDNNSAKLTLWVAQSTSAGQMYVLSFQVLNPMTGIGSALPYGQDSSSTLNIESLGASQDTLKRGIPTYNPTSLGNSYRYVRGAPTGSNALDLSSDRPCCLCNMTYNDSRPMRVKLPYFCVKNIGQSSAWPCSPNTITVTFVPTTALQVNATITISNLTGASFPTGPIQLVDPVAGQAQNSFSYAALSVPGFGNWDNQSKSVTLFLVKSIDYSVDYVLSFQIQNPPLGQSMASVLIQASNLKSGWPQSGIQADYMVSNPKTSPMYVYTAVFLASQFSQSSTRPCDCSTITVTLQANVPMFSLKFNFCSCIHPIIFG